MKLSELAEKLELELLTAEGYADRDITGCYIGDLLSWVMGKAEEGNVWITIMTNINIVAVAALTGCACVLAAENVLPDSTVIEKANMQEIVIFRSPKSIYELAVAVNEAEKA